MANRSTRFCNFTKLLPLFAACGLAAPPSLFSTEPPAREIHWQQLPQGYRPILTTAVSRDGQFALCGRGNRLFAYHLPSDAPAVELVDPMSKSAHRDMVRSLAIDASGSFVASGGFREVKLWKSPHVQHRANWPHDVDVTAVAVAAGVAATGDESGVVRIWDIATNSLRQTFQAPQAATTGLAFSPDGKTLYSVSQDKSLRAWNAADGSALGKIEAKDPLHAVIVIEGGGAIVTGDASGEISIWDAAALRESSGDEIKPRKEIQAHTGAAASLAAFPAKPAEFVSGGEDALVRRWNTSSDKSLSERKCAGPVAAVAVSSAGDRIAAAGAGHFTLFHAENGKPIVERAGDPRLAVQVEEIDAEIAFTKSALTLAKADIKSYEGSERRVKTTAESVKKAEEELAKVEKTRDEKKAALEKIAAESAENKKKVEAAEKTLADAQNAVVVAGTVIERAKAIAERATQTFADEQAAVTQKEELQKQQESAKEQAASAAKKPAAFRGVAFSADGNRVALGTDDGALHFFDAASGAYCQTQATNDDPVRSLAFAADATLVCAAGKQTMTYSAGSQWQLVRTLGGSAAKDVFADRVLALDFSPDGRSLISGGGVASQSGELKLWSVADGKLPRGFRDAASDTIFAARFSPDGQRVAIAGADRLVKVFHVETGELIRSFAGHTAHVLGVAWQADGKLLASCGGDHVIKLWDVETGLPVQTMKGTTYKIGRYKGEVTALTFLGGSEQILACSGDGTVRLHRTSSENDILAYSGASGYQYSVAATPDGRTLFSGGSDGTLRLWSGENRPVKKELR